MTEEKQKNSFSSGLFFGAIIGAVLFFLFGTNEGRQIKKKLTEKGKEAIDDLPDLIKDLEKKGHQFAQKAEEVKQTLDEKTKEITPKVKQEVNLVLKQIEETQERGRQAAKSVRRRFFTKSGRKLG